MRKVFVNEPKLDGNEKKYLEECIDTGWISFEGPFVKRLEEGMAHLTDRKYGVAVSNGSTALETAIMALQLQAGDEVILPTFTIISCAAPIVRVGAKPVLVDSDAKTWNMRVEDIESKITKRTKAIMVVHIYGLPVDMKPVLALAEKYQLAIIEDAAEMHGQTYRDRPCGSFGDISTFSFYPNKHITSGEGGMVLTDSKALAERMRAIRNLFFSEKKRYVHEELGYNFRMTNLQAAVGCAQLKKLPSFIEKRRRNFAHLKAALCSVADKLILPEPCPHSEPSWFGFLLTCREGVEREPIVRALEAHGIQTRMLFAGNLVKHPCFDSLREARSGYRIVGELTNTDRIMRDSFWVGLFPGMTEEKLSYMAEMILEGLS